MIYSITLRLVQVFLVIAISPDASITWAYAPQSGEAHQRTDVDEREAVVNVNQGLVKLDCGAGSEVRILIATQIKFFIARPYEDGYCHSVKSQIEQLTRYGVGQIRRTCAGKSACSFAMDELLSYSADYKAKMMPVCMKAIDWQVMFVCVVRSRIFGGECDLNTPTSKDNPFSLATASKSYGFLLSAGYPNWPAAAKECYWKIEQADNHRYTYIEVYDVDLSATGHTLRMHKNHPAGTWQLFFQNESLNVMPSWQTQVESATVRFDLARTSSANYQEQELRRGFALYYEVVQHVCSVPPAEQLQSSWQQKNVMWPPVTSGDHLTARCELDHVFVGTTLKMKASQCIDANWSPPLDELIGEGCQAIEGSGKVKGDLQRSTIIAIVCGSLAAFVLLIIVVLLLTLKRKYHTFFPCFRKASKPGHLPATKQPRYTPSTAGNSGYLSGIDRIESDRSNATTYTIVSNPYRPTSQLVSMDALIANSQYAPVLKTPTADGNSTISTSHYAPMSVISADSYGDCDVRGSPRSAYTPMHPGEIAHKGPPTDDEEEETLYEDPVQSPVNNTTAKSLNSRAPRLPKMPKYDSTDEDSCANYDEPVAVKTNDAPPPPTAGRFSLRAPLHTESSIDNEIPPVANDEKHVTKPSDQTAAGIRPIFKPYDSSSSEDEYERVGIPKNDKIKRNRQSVPDYNPPPPPAPKPRFTKKPIVPADAPLEPPERPAKPSKAIIPSAAAQHWKKIPARTSEYIDFKDRVSSVPAVIAPGLRESSM